MAQVRVWNDNVHPYEELFKGEKIKIPPKSFIQMDMEEAVHFRGTMPPLLKRGDGTQDPLSYKMIRIQEGSEPIVEIKRDELTCMACSYHASSKEDLHEHEGAAHAAQVTVDEEAEKEVAKKRGRPPKAATA